MPNEQKPLNLNNARVMATKNYRVLHSIERVEKDIWKGKAIQQQVDNARLAAQQETACERDWMFFHRDYDFEQNDWDRLYHEHEINDESIFGVKVLLVPIEKLLFAYQPPTGEGIILPITGSVLGGRNRQ